MLPHQPRVQPWPPSCPLLAEIDRGATAASNFSTPSIGVVQPRHCWSTVVVTGMGPKCRRLSLSYSESRHCLGSHQIELPLTFSTLEQPAGGCRHIAGCHRLSNVTMPALKPPPPRCPITSVSPHCPLLAQRL
jgi:hypothetical protein